MKPTEYIKNVLITEARDMAPLQERFSNIRNIRLLHGAIGLASELSEIRVMASQEFIDAVNLKEEMGDVFWYMGLMIDELKLDPSEIFCAMVTINERLDEESRRILLDETIDEMTVAIGNAVDLLKKSLMYGKELNIDGLSNELQELDSNVAFALALYDIDPGQARERNIEKLRARYGEKFTEAAALERNLGAERKILENK